MSSDDKNNFPRGDTPQFSDASSSLPRSSTRILGRTSNDHYGNDALLCFDFNQDGIGEVGGQCRLVVGTTNSIRICNTDMLLKSQERRENGSNESNMIEQQQQQQIQDRVITPRFLDHYLSTQAKRRKIRAVEMLCSCNKLALVVTDDTENNSSSECLGNDQVLIWDFDLNGNHYGKNGDNDDNPCHHDYVGGETGRLVCELTFYHRVLAVKLTRDRICVVLCDRIHVYNFGTLKLLDTISTGSNHLGLLCISKEMETDGNVAHNYSGLVLVCPTTQEGQVRVKLYKARKSFLIDAHKGKLAAMALTENGSHLATASERGTIVRLFSINTRNPTDKSLPKMGSLLKEFRRGFEQARIESLSFSLDKSWLACASDHGTIHIFQVHTAKTTFKKLKEKSVGGQKSFVQVRGFPHPKTCTFVGDRSDTIAVAGLDDFGHGYILLSSFKSVAPVCDDLNSVHKSGDENEKSKVYATKGEAQKLSYHRFFKNSCTGHTPNNQENSGFDGEQLMMKNNAQNDKGVKITLFGGNIDDRLICWHVAGCRIDWNIGWEIGRQVGRNISKHICGLIGKPIGGHIATQIGWHFGWYIGKYVGLYVGEYVGWCIGKRVGWRIGKRLSKNGKIKTCKQIDWEMDWHTGADTSTVTPIATPLPTSLTVRDNVVTVECMDNDLEYIPAISHPDPSAPPCHEIMD